MTLHPDCVQYQSDLRGACGPQDGGKLTKNIVPVAQLSTIFFRVPFGVSLSNGESHSVLEFRVFWQVRTAKLKKQRSSRSQQCAPGRGTAG